jgi:hypothetical protein
MENEEIELRVVARPYLAYLIIGRWAPPYLLYGIIITPENRANLIYALLTFIAIFSWLFMVFWLYRVRLRDGLLTESGLLRITKRVPASSIRRWRYEIGWPKSEMVLAADIAAVPAHSDLLPRRQS